MLERILLDLAQNHVDACDISVDGAKIKQLVAVYPLNQAAWRAKKIVGILSRDVPVYEIIVPRFISYSLSIRWRNRVG